MRFLSTFLIGTSLVAAQTREIHGNLRGRQLSDQHQSRASRSIYNALHSQTNRHWLFPKVFTDIGQVSRDDDSELTVYMFKYIQSTNFYGSYNQIYNFHGKTTLTENGTPKSVNVVAYELNENGNRYLMVFSKSDQKRFRVNTWKLSPIQGDTYINRYLNNRVLQVGKVDTNNPRLKNLIPEGLPEEYQLKYLATPTPQRAEWLKNKWIVKTEQTNPFHKNSTTINPLHSNPDN